MISKHSARINEEYDAVICINEVEFDGHKFCYGTGLVTIDFHRWFSEQVVKSKEPEHPGFEGRVRIGLEDGRVGLALISHVSKHDPEFGSKIVFFFQSGLGEPKLAESA